MIWGDRKPCAASTSELRRAMREPPGSAPKVTKPGGTHIVPTATEPADVPGRETHFARGVTVHPEARQGRRDLGGRSQRPIARLPPCSTCPHENGGHLKKPVDQRGVTLAGQSGTHQ